LGQKIANRSFGNVAVFKNLGTAVINQNLIQEETKERCLLSKNMQDYNFAFGSVWV
jgi:hypothetical protein